MPKSISIAKARRTLGPLANTLSDDQVEYTVEALQLLAHEQVVYNGSKSKENGNDTTPDDNT